jgi:hypothetical protein
MQRNTRNFSPAALPPKAPGKPEAPQSAPMGNALTPNMSAPAPSVAPQAQSSLGRAISHLGGK